MTIELDPIASGYSTTKINTNFDKVEAEFNTNVLRRNGLAVGEANQMAVPLDMNSNDILNVNNLDVQGFSIQNQSISGFVQTAATAATAASLSATNAGVSETNAGVSETNAAASAVQAGVFAAASETPALRAELVNAIDPTKGAAVVGVDGENVYDTILRKSPYRDLESVDLMIVYGQSNARGYATTTPGAPVYNVPLAKVWNGTSLIDLTSYTPTANDGISTGSAWAAAANHYCKETSRRLVIANCARASQSIAELQKGTANYTALLGWVAGAKAQIISEGRTVGNIFVSLSQGERDSQLKTAPVAYTNSLSQLWTDLKIDTAATRLFVFTVGYYADSNLLHGQAIQQAQRIFARDQEDVLIAYDDLGCFGSHNKLKVDSVHYNQRGYNIMGREGAARMVSALFPDTGAPASDEGIERFGRLGMNQSQAWNLHAGVLRRAAGSIWTVNHTTPIASSMLLSAAELTDRVKVKLTNPLRTVLNYGAYTSGALAEAGVFARVGTGANPASGLVSVDVDGYSYADLFFSGNVYLLVDMVLQTASLGSMGVTLSGLLPSITVTFPSTGRADIVHPAVRGLPTASIKGDIARVLRVNSVGESSTILQTRDITGALVNDVIAVMLPNMLIPPTAFSVTSEVSLQIIGADYAIW
jgi:hypothetical protein